MRRLLTAACIAAAVTMAVPAPPAGALGGHKPPAPAAKAWTFGAHRCRLIAVPTAAPVGVAQACQGVRPGAAVFSPSGRCTLNFMWKGDDGFTYMGTAGHCFLDGTAVSVARFGPGFGPPAFDSERRRIGTLAFAALNNQHDFALIRLDPAVAATASPALCHFGGPVGTSTAPVGLLAPLPHFGQGNLTGTLIPARTQLALDASDPQALLGVGVATPGDSGSPVLSADGRAFGVLVATGPAVGPVAATGLVVTVPISSQLAFATQVTGVRYTLQTAPLA